MNKIRSYKWYNKKANRFLRVIDNGIMEDVYTKVRCYRYILPETLDIKVYYHIRKFANLRYDVKKGKIRYYIVNYNGIVECLHPGDVIYFTDCGNVIDIKNNYEYKKNQDEIVKPIDIDSLFNKDDK